MHIQDYFKNGKAKKHVHTIKSVDGVVSLFFAMNSDSKEFDEWDVDRNFKTRNIVFDNGSKQNLWEVMVKFGAIKITKANKRFKVMGCYV